MAASVVSTSIVLVLVLGLAYAGTYSHREALAILSRAGISVRSSRDCSDRSRKQCTSLDGIHAQCIDGSAGIVVLKRASGCPITVTGGTEVGHASGARSHEDMRLLSLRWGSNFGHIGKSVQLSATNLCNGWKLDIAMNTCLTNYITSTFHSIGGNKWRAPSGNVYFNERNHWDIAFAG